jgi:serine/threonine protein kinase
VDTLKTLGKYQIRRRIGRGGMGVVYEAYDPNIEREVAIKTIARDQFDAAEAAQHSAEFKREAQAAGKLNHPHIVTVFDFGEEAGFAYIVMELIRGGELKQMLESGQKMPLPQVVAIMEQLLQALAYSHKRGVIHRDIKPANIMLDEHGDVKLADFGIARIESTQATMTQIKGTPVYMSPEQVEGEQLDRRSDLYSAGVVLYEMLTGSRPFTGSFVSLVNKILLEPHQPPSERDPGVPVQFDAVLDRALAKRRDDRFANAGEFSAALRKALEHSGFPSDGTEIFERAPVVTAPPVALPRLEADRSTDTGDASRPTGNTDAAEIEFWRSVKDSRDAEDLADYLVQYPSGQFRGIAERKLVKLRGEATGTGTGSSSTNAAAIAEAQRAKAKRAREAAELALREAQEAEEAAQREAEKERLEAEQRAAAEAERKRIDEERKAAEEVARLRAEQEREEAKRRAAEEAERKRIEEERKAAEEAARLRAEQEREEAKRRAAEEAERTRLEELRKAAEEAARRKAENKRLDDERRAAEKKAERVREAELRKAAEEADRLKAEQERLDAEQRAAEAERMREQALREAAEEADRLKAEHTRLEVERRAIEEATRLAAEATERALSTRSGEEAERKRKAEAEAAWLKDQQARLETVRFDAPPITGNAPVAVADTLPAADNGLHGIPARPQKGGNKLMVPAAVGALAVAGVIAWMLGGGEDPAPPSVPAAQTAQPTELAQERPASTDRQGTTVVGEAQPNSAPSAIQARAEADEAARKAELAAAETLRIQTEAEQRTAERAASEQARKQAELAASEFAASELARKKALDDRQKSRPGGRSRCSQESRRRQTQGRTCRGGRGKQKERRRQTESGNRCG